MWATDKNEKVALAGYIDDHKPLPFADSVLPYLEKSRTPPFPRLVRAVTLTIAALLAIASFLLLGGIVSRRPLSLELKFSGICGIIAHVGLLVSALGSVGIPRYTIGVWPPLEIGILFFAAWAGKKIMQFVGLSSMRSAGSPCNSPGRCTLSIAISGVNGATETPGLLQASSIQVGALLDGHELLHRFSAC